MGVELVTYKTHLILINLMAAIDVVRGLDMMQAVRGSLVNIIMDSYPSHITLQRQGETDSRSKLVKLLEGNRALLAASGIKITVAAGKRHERVGRAEKMIAQVKNLLLEKI